MGFFKDKSLRHFRGRTVKVNGKNVTHPVYVVGRLGKKYMVFTLTHSPKKGRANYNHRLKVNPDPTDKQHSYLRKQLHICWRHELTKERYEDLKMSPEDDIYIDKLIERIEKRMKNVPLHDQPLARDTHRSGDVHMIHHQKDNGRENLQKNPDEI